MRKLLRAGADRVRTMKTFWLGAAVLAAYGFLIIGDRYRNFKKWGFSLEEAFDSALVSYVIIFGIVLSVFCSLFIGTEYSDGTIRNKLMIGRSRTDIYLTNFISCTAAGIVQYAAASAAVMAAGFLIFGKPGMGAGQIAGIYVTGLFLCASYMAVYTLVSMLVSGKAYAAIVNILLAFGFLLAASYLYSMLSQPEMIREYTFGASAADSVPNPYYVSGLQRSIYEFLYDFLPGGQTAQMVNGLEGQPLWKTALLWAYSTVIVILSNAAGILLFRRKDIK